MSYDFNDRRIRDLEQEIKELKRNAEQLIIIAFSINELRNLWRGKFKLPEKERNEIW